MRLEHEPASEPLHGSASLGDAFLPPALRAGSNRLFQLLDLCLCSLEFDGVWYKSRRLKQTIIVSDRNVIVSDRNITTFVKPSNVDSAAHPLCSAPNYGLRQIIFLKEW